MDCPSCAAHFTASWRVSTGTALIVQVALVASSLASVIPSFRFGLTSSVSHAARVALLLLAVAVPAWAQVPHGPEPGQVSVCFTPASHCAGVIAAAIAGAQHQVRVQAYGFTSAPILRELAAAHRRGIDVAVILDKSQDHRAEDRGRYSGAVYMGHAGVPVWIDDLPAIAHNKVVVIDEHLVVTGSFNFTASAERRNAENVVLIDSPEVARWFLDNWLSRQAVSRLYEAPP